MEIKNNDKMPLTDLSFRPSSAALAATVLGAVCVFRILSLEERLQLPFLGRLVVRPLVGVEALDLVRLHGVGRRPQRGVILGLYVYRLSPGRSLPRHGSGLGLGRSRTILGR